MRRTDRLFELVQLFRGGRLWRGKDLAARLEVSLRTVYRDIDTLVASGVPIEGERGVGYILREPIFLPPLTLTPLELEALHLGMRMVSRAGDSDLATAAQSLNSKIDAVLPSERRGQTYADGIELYAPHPGGAHFFLPLLREAIETSSRLKLKYRRINGTKTERYVRPLRLEYWGRVWTLTSWCELRDDFRVFRVDRIEDAAKCGQFRQEDGKTYEDFLKKVHADSAL